jgi:hypothetical protein
MRQIVIDIPEKEYRFFMKVIRSFPFVRINEKKNKLLIAESGLSQPKRKQWESVKQGLRETQLIEKGKMEGKPAADFLNEL